MIFIVDFGSQTAHLIGRRIRELGSEIRIIHPEEILKILQSCHSGKPKAHPESGSWTSQDDKGIKGIILSGGPSSVYEENAPTINPEIFALGIPILGICYGLQLMAKLMGGKVVPGRKEYGPATLTLKSEIRNPKSETNSNVQNSKISQTSSTGFEFRNLRFDITEDLVKSFVVWMSHGDEVVELPEGFKTLGSTEHVKHAFVASEEKKIYGVQFHPEVEHTEFGNQILKNFIEICHGSVILGSPAQLDDSRIDSGQARMTKNNDLIGKLTEDIKEKVGDSYVIGAVSGGVDSTVAGTLTAKAIGDKFIPVYVENGLMREGTAEHVKKIFGNLSIKPIVINTVGETLARLQGIVDPEEKRKIIGNFYIEIFEKEMVKQIKLGKNVKFLLQGTIYSDVIESKGSKHASKIKSHHNVGGLPQNMTLKLLEPLRNFYKDEVREIGRALGLPNEFVDKQVFPGPGYAIRIRGEVTKERLEKEKIADKIVLEELEKAGILDKIFMSFPVLTGASSTAVKGDGRFFGEVVAIRIVESKDVMTSHWANIPYAVLQKISSRIVNEIPEISRVVYDITTKPPATMEWE